MFFTSCQGCATTSAVSEDRGSSQIEAETEQDEVPEPVIVPYSSREVTGGPVTFTETWGYVMQNRLGDYNKNLPVSDVCLFAAEVNSYGELTSVPSRKIINVGKARCHLVFVCDSRSLSHFVLDPQYGIRDRMIDDIVKAGKDFDGIQLDFEYIPARDRRNYIEFIRILRSKIPDKIFSLCVPARFRLLSEDLHPYAELASLCDRIFVMAYDEHWSTSAAGPVASVDWCRKVMDYGLRSVPAEKLIMGIPFYGRAWGDKTTSTAYTFNGVNRVLNENKNMEVVYENDIPKFKYSTTVNVTGYFNDAYSAVNLSRLYQESGVKNLGFWRIGQEDPAFWQYLQLASQVQLTK